MARHALATPRRAVVGWDSGRLAMVLAVLDARCGLAMAGRDVYLNVILPFKVPEGKFIKAAESQGDLKIIEGADPHLEMGAIYELSLENLYPPVLLFRKMKGCDPSAQIIMNVRTSKFMVHDEKNEAKVGDLVTIEESRPLSARKRWRLVEVVERGEGGAA